jgi:hypothetical protein
MPGALRCIKKEDEMRTMNDDEPPNPKFVKLWLPSELPEDERCTGCAGNLVELEGKLQAAQCHQALDNIRDRLHAKKHLINRCNRNVTGQYKSTCARNLIGHVGDRVTTHFKKYNRARNALWALGGEVTFGQTFKELRTKHLVLDGEDTPPDAEASQKMNLAGGGAGPRNKKKQKDKAGNAVQRKSRRILSWIWVAGDVPGEGENGALHTCKSSL